MIDLLVLGEVNADLVLRGDVVPTFGQREQLLDAADLVLGGAGAITACAAARLGLRVAYAGLAGDDLIGSFALGQIAARGVDTAGVRVRPGAKSALGIILARGDGDRAILTYPGLIPAFATGDIDPALVAAARHVHVGAHFLQTGLHAGLPALFEAHRARGGTTSLDPNWDPSGRWEVGALAEHLDLLFPNDVEAERLGPTIDAVLRAGGEVVVKLGAAGAVRRAFGGDLRCAAPTGIVVADTVGAGDTFDAGYLAGLLAGLGPGDRLALACAAGSLSTLGAGGIAAQPTRAEADALAATLVEAGR